MPWQPVPPPAACPGKSNVERLCGQPEQKFGMRTGVEEAPDKAGRRSSATRLESPAPVKTCSRIVAIMSGSSSL